MLLSFTQVISNSVNEFQYGGMADFYRQSWQTDRMHTNSVSIVRLFIRRFRAIQRSTGQEKHCILVSEWRNPRPKIRRLADKNISRWRLKCKKKDMCLSWQAFSRDWLSGVMVTKAPFVNFSINTIFDLAKVPVLFVQSHSYLTSVAAARQRRHLSNINVTSNS